jgi:hypothetical protein
LLTAQNPYQKSQALKILQKTNTHTHIQSEREKKTTITVKFLPEISSPQELTGTNKHTPKEKNNSKSLSFAPANQINQNSYPKSRAHKILQK